ncbi:MAG: hypothetical protein MUE41_18235 [Gemmatimonadaceae bacterium]|jgi:hypothetical protein|nr:hypothetical protein [Gemmatimonadaceae bacterium]
MSATPDRPVRTRHHLRELIDEMMASIRVAANADLWTAEERARSEAELARIMEQVRREVHAPNTE